MGLLGMVLLAGHEAVLAEIHNSMADYAIKPWRVCG